MQLWNAEGVSALALASPMVGEEIDPDVVVRRRTFLRAGLSAAGLGLLGAAGLTGCASSKGGASREDAPEALADDGPRPMSADDFLALVIPDARALIAAPTPDEEAYVAAASALLARVEAAPQWNPSPGPTSMDYVAWYPPIVLLQIEMAPGSVMHLHDHRHYNGVLLATKGAARCRNFDIVQEDGQRLDVAAGEVPAKGEDFLIRQNSDVVLRPRQLSTLTRDRDNIHHVQAGDEGATLLDLFTHFSPEARSYGLEWDGEPYDDASQLYKVAWKDA